MQIYYTRTERGWPCAYLSGNIYLQTLDFIDLTCRFTHRKLEEGVEIEIHNWKRDFSDLRDYCKRVWVFNNWCMQQFQHTRNKQYEEFLEKQTALWNSMLNAEDDDD